MDACLGHVQRAIIGRLAGGDQTTATLADLASRSVVGDSLRRLAGRGLARVAARNPAATPHGGGMPRDVWSITGPGRSVHAELTR